MNKKQPETRAHTKKAIKDAFWSLYKEKRIEKITVKDVTMKAGYNRSTFYAYFEDVYDVLEQIKEEVMPGIDHLPIVETGKGPSQDFMERLIKLYEKNSEYYSVLLSERGDPTFAIKMKEIFKGLMKESMSGFVQEDASISELELDYALEFYTGATISDIKHWYDRNQDMPMDMLLPLMHQLMSNQFAMKLMEQSKKQVE